MNTPTGRTGGQVAVVMATTADPTRAEFLNDLHDSLLAQDDVDWRWVIVVDGPDGRLPEPITTDERVTVRRNLVRRGAAVSRNLALGLVTAPWVTSVDDDDLLTPRSLRARLDAVADDVGWIAGASSFLNENGSIEPREHPFTTGLTAPGTVWRAWEGPEAMFPLRPTTIMARTDLMRQAGGWQALSQGEDFGMVMAVTGTTPGWMLTENLYLYRRHPAQMIREPGFDHDEQLIREITYERGRLLATTSTSSV